MENKGKYNLELIKSEIKLSDKKYRHVLGVEESALELAARHYPFLDSNAVSAAALMHDYTKEYTNEEHFEVFERCGVKLTEDELINPKLYHSISASAIARERYNADEDVYNAVLYHTTGCKDMTPLEKLIYFADFIEKNRKNAGCVSVRENYYMLLDAELKKPQPDLEEMFNAALLFSFDMTIVHLLKECQTIHPHTFEARNFIIRGLADADYLHKDRKKIES